MALFEQLSKLQTTVNFTDEELLTPVKLKIKWFNNEHNGGQIQKENGRDILKWRQGINNDTLDNIILHRQNNGSLVIQSNNTNDKFFYRLVSNGAIIGDNIIGTQFTVHSVPNSQDWFFRLDNQIVGLRRDFFAIGKDVVALFFKVVN